MKPYKLAIRDQMLIQGKGINRNQNKTFLRYHALIFLLIVSIGHPWLAQVHATPIETLYFSPKKNGFKVLNQKISFEILNNDTFHLGPFFFSKSSMTFELTGALSEPGLRFVGPLRFMQNSKLLIKDHTGKPLWQRDLKNIKIESRPTPKDLNEPDGELGSYEELKEARPFLESASKQLFFTFCLLQETGTRRFNICSIDYSVSQQHGIWTLEAVKTPPIENQIIINGVEVGTDGEIQISKNLSVNIVARLKSGLLIEIRTREFPFEIVDYDFSAEEAKIRLAIRPKEGKLGGNRLQIFYQEVSTEGPYFFIEDPVFIPLKQELVIPKELLPNKKKPQVLVSQKKTYKSTVEIPLTKSEDVVLKSLSKVDQVDQTKDSATWKINDLVKQRANVRSIELSDTPSGQKYIGDYAIIRGQPLDVAIGSSFEQTQLPSTKIKTYSSGPHLTAEYYFSDLLFLSDSEWNYLHWFFALDWSLLREKGSSNGNVKERLSCSLGYRFRGGLHHLDPTWSLTLGSQRFNSNDQSQQGPTLGLRYDNPVFTNTFLGDRISSHLNYTLATASEKKPNSIRILELQWESRYLISKAWSWSWTLRSRLENSQIAEEPPQEMTTIGFTLGAHRLF